jgi:predicted Zn-dependent protease
MKTATLPLLFSLILLSTARADQPADRLTSRPRPAIVPAKELKVGQSIETTAGQRRRLGLPGGGVLFVNENTALKLDDAGQLSLSRGVVYVESASGRLVIQTPRRRVSGKGPDVAVWARAKGTGVLVTRGKVTVSGLKQLLHAGQVLVTGSDKIIRAPRASLLLDWTRDLKAAAESPLVPRSNFSGGALLAIDPNGQEAKLELRKFHVDVFIEGGFARTTIDQTYFNKDPWQMEGTFYFPLPPDAQLSQLAMYVDGNLMEGGMVERDYARQVYESMRYRMADPALLEWVDGSTFKMRVFPLEPRQEKRILLSYTQKLPALYGQLQYRFPAGHSLQQVRDWSFHARVKGGAKAAWHSPSHPLTASSDGDDLVLDGKAKNARTSGDVVLSVADPMSGAAVRFAADEQDGWRYFMVRVRPELLRPAEAAPLAPKPGPRSWVFLFESSGDRDPLLSRVQIEVVRGLLMQADPDDTFQVLTAGTRVRAFSKTPLPVTAKNVQEAIEFLENSHLIGALDLGLALKEAVKLSGGGGPPEEPGEGGGVPPPRSAGVLPLLANSYLVYLGSGIAAMGEHRQDVLAKLIPDGVRYVGVGVGRRWDRSLMKAAAERTGGYFTQINPDEPVSWRAFDLAATLRTLPADRLGGVVVRIPGRDVPLLYVSRSLAPGEELCALARLPAKEALPAAVELRLGDGEPFRLAVQDVTASAAYLPRAWAKLEIDRLLAEDALKHKKAVIALSKAMYVMTPFTSLLVLENEDQYVQYKVDRSRKDRWALYPAPKKIAVVYEPDPDLPNPKAKAGQRLPARQVVKTVLVREPLQFLIWPAGSQAPEEEEEETETGSPAVEMPSPVPSLAKIPHLNGAFFGRAGEIGGSMDLDGRLVARGRMALESHGRGPLPRPSSEVLIVGDEVAKDRVILHTLGLAPGRVLDYPQLKLAEAELLAGQIGDYPVKLEPPGPERQFRLIDLKRLGDEIRIQGQRQISVYDGEKVALATKLSAPLLFQSPALGLVVRDPSRIRYKSTGGILGTGSNPLLYRRPSYSGQDRLFYDLVAYCPGLNTSAADIEAVLEAEALPDPADKRGKIDEGARALIDKSRPAGWQALTLGGPGGFTILYDGTGRYAWQRTLPPGIREQVVCDGKQLLHLYPQLGLAARRAVSRFHREDFSALVPWVLPPAADLARGADVKRIGPHTVAIIPIGADSLRDKKGKPLSYLRLELVFAENGRLAERRLTLVPKGEVLLRQVCEPGGTVRLLDKKGKELAVEAGKLSAPAEPDLTPDTKGLVVLNLPYRTRDHVVASRKLQKVQYANMRFADALELLAADFAAGSAEAAKVFKEAFYSRDQRLLGFYVLLAACGQNLDAENLDVLGEYPDEPLAQNLALHSSPVLRKHASQWAVQTTQWSEGYLQYLALTHALLQRWQNERISKGSPAKLKTERERALKYVRQHADSAFGWALLCLMEDRAGKDKTAHAALVDAWKLFEDKPGLNYTARYEAARCLFKAGQRAEARKRFRGLYEETLKDKVLPPLDSDFRQALLGGEDLEDGWTALMQQTAAHLAKEKHRPAVLALARQCWQLDDPALANQLVGVALDGAPEKQRPGLTLAAVLFYQETSQLPQADDLLQKLLADKKLSRNPGLWRLAAEIAARRDMTARSLECLERALDAEYAHLPAVIDLQQVRTEYGKLLEHYQTLTDAMAALKVQPPAGFVAKVVRTADRWRALDHDEQGPACDAAARILRALGDREMGWDYLTTPVGLKPNESGPWQGLAQSLRRTGDLALADRAYRAACEAEPTNADLLWDRAQNLREAGKGPEARGVLRQIAEGHWQPRFQPTQARARALLTGS